MGKKVCRYLAAGWGRGKLTDEESNGPGECARPQIRRLNEPVALGCRRVRLAPEMSKIPPACGHIFLNAARGGRVLVHPRAGALPETMALSRLWRGDRLQRRFAWPVEFVVPLEIRGSNFYHLAIRLGQTHSISQRV